MPSFAYMVHRISSYLHRVNQDVSALSVKALPQLFDNMPTWPGDPWSENLRDARFNGDFDIPFEYGHHRNAPAENAFRMYIPGVGWTQNGRKLRNNFKTNKYWARPIDGTRRGTFGRLADVLTNKGADVFLVLNGDRRTLMRDMPHRPRWTNWDSLGRARFDVNRGAPWEDKDWYPNSLPDMPWAARPNGKVYDFNTRKYVRVTPHNIGGLWSDAAWDQNERRNDIAPTYIRDGLGRWQRGRGISPWAPWYPGGRSEST